MRLHTGAVEERDRSDSLQPPETPEGTQQSSGRHQPPRGPRRTRTATVPTANRAALTRARRRWAPTRPGHRRGPPGTKRLGNAPPAAQLARGGPREGRGPAGCGRPTAARDRRKRASSLPGPGLDPPGARGAARAGAHLTSWPRRWACARRGPWRGSSRRRAVPGRQQRRAPARRSLIHSLPAARGLALAAAGPSREERVRRGRAGAAQNRREGRGRRQPRSPRERSQVLSAPRPPQPPLRNRKSVSASQLPGEPEAK